MGAKEDIKKVALSLFSKNGYESVSVQKIVEQVGVKKPTLYYYYGSKEGVITSILDSFYLDFLTILENKTVYNGDIVNSLEEIMFHYYKSFTKNSEFYHLNMAMIYSPKESSAYNFVKTYLQKQYQILEDFFKEVEKQHKNLSGKSKMLSYSLLGVINSGISYYLYTSDSSEITDEKIRMLSKKYMYGIFSL